MSAQGREAPLFRCEFVADPDEVADIVMSAGMTRSQIRASLTLAVVEIIIGVAAMVGGLATSNAVVFAAGLAAAAFGAFGAYRCSGHGLRRRYAKVYARWPSTGQETVVEVFEDRVAHTTSSARGEWDWSHFESAWVSEDVGVMLSTASGRAALTIPVGALDGEAWRALCATVRSKLPPP